MFHNNMELSHTKSNKRILQILYTHIFFLKTETNRLSDCEETWRVGGYSQKSQTVRKKDVTFMWHDTT